MSEIFIPEARLLECSAFIQENIERNGLVLGEHSEAIVAMGKILLDHKLPELGYLLKREVHVEANGAVQFYQDERNPFTSAEFTGLFDGIRIAEVERPEFIEGFGEFKTEQVDVIFAFRQKISDPDPVDLGYSDEVLVPLSDMALIRRQLAA